MTLLANNVPYKVPLDAFVTLRNISSDEQKERCEQMLSNTSTFTKTRMRIGGKEFIAWKTTKEHAPWFANSLKGDDASFFEFYARLDDKNQFVHVRGPGEREIYLNTKKQIPAE